MSTPALAAVAGQALTGHAVHQPMATDTHGRAHTHTHTFASIIFKTRQQLLIKHRQVTEAPTAQIRVCDNSRHTTYLGGGQQWWSLCVCVWWGGSGELLCHNDKYRCSHSLTPHTLTLLHTLALQDASPGCGGSRWSCGCEARRQRSKESQFSSKHHARPDPTPTRWTRGQLRQISTVPQRSTTLPVND